MYWWNVLCIDEMYCVLMEYVWWFWFYEMYVYVTWCEFDMSIYVFEIMWWWNFSMLNCVFEMICDDVCICPWLMMIWWYWMMMMNDVLFSIICIMYENVLWLKCNEPEY